ncbi:lipoprotein [Streptomyces sp. NPDC001315]|uniref:lipoprotein n=1 Tax=Streptomyces sp. NPDC001315 TaxID=3364562 RepID=UPI00369FB454
MRVGAGKRAWHGLAPVLVLVGALTACGQDQDAEKNSKASAKTSAAAESGGTSGTGAESGGTIGADGSACELPVTFDLARKWKAEAIDNGAAGSAELGDMILRQGPVAAVCEIDAKPAGNIGFLRVFTGAPGDADTRAVLEAFVADEGKVSEEKYATFKAGDLEGVEVKYLYTSELLDETKEESALAVSTSDGPVVLHLGGMDTEEHEAMLPALELAKRTLRAA